MASTENDEHKSEIQEEVETARPSTGMKLVDYIPIYIPTIEQGLIVHNQHEERFLDFLKAHPRGDWFVKSGFVHKLSPLSCFGRSSTQPSEPSPSDDPAQNPGRRRFRVPFVRKINWGALIRHFKKWIRSPANVALFIWLIACAVGLIIYVLVISGLLNGALRSSTKRKDWEEVINQILNALFTIMCIYQHPKPFHHLVMLLRWKPEDKVEVRKVYCKDGTRRPHDRAQMLFVVILLHVTCFSQYVMCALYWGYGRRRRPDWAVNLCLGIGIAAPIIAGVYTVYGPLGRRYDNNQPDQESQSPQQGEVRVYNRRVIVTTPEWIGGLFDCWDDQTACCLSFFCTFCVFGWNMERLGFGNMYVHMATFILLCIAPILVFGVAALNIDDSTIGYIVAITGLVLCVFGLLYGGFWRVQMRKRFKLPANPFCCGYPPVTDCVQWLFCWACSLAQEVRTANFYDIEDDGFYRKVTDEEGRSVLVPLPREVNFGYLDSRSRSCPAKIEPLDERGSMRVPEDQSQNELSFTFERSSTYSEMHTMAPPLPVLIRQDG